MFKLENGNYELTREEVLAYLTLKKYVGDTSLVDFTLKEIIEEYREISKELDSIDFKNKSENNE